MWTDEQIKQFAKQTSELPGLGWIHVNVHEQIIRNLIAELGTRMNTRAESDRITAQDWMERAAVNVIDYIANTSTSELSDARIADLKPALTAIIHKHAPTESDRIRELELELATYRDAAKQPLAQSESLALKWMNEALNLRAKLAALKPLAIALSDALEHVHSCEHCNNDLWDRCPSGGVEAHATMKRAQKELEGK